MVINKLDIFTKLDIFRAVFLNEPNGNLLDGIRLNLILSYKTMRYTVLFSHNRIAAI